MVIVVGLGNPGEEYLETRHNFGFRVVDRLVKNYGLAWREMPKLRAAVAPLNSHRHRFGDVLFIKPQTYMNQSGEAVGALKRFYRVDPKNIWVITDDLDLPLGTVRVRHAGEAGGHRGMESIIEQLDCREFPRLRLGIRGGSRRQDRATNQVDANMFVLERFAPAEVKLKEQVEELAATIVQQAIERGELPAHTYRVEGLDGRLDGTAERIS